MIRERAPAKVNLLLQVGGRRRDGLHELCSIFASIDLADTVTVEESGEADEVRCPGVDGPNLAAAAVAAFRAAAVRELPKGSGLPGGIKVTIEKRIPIAAGLGGGSADAAAVLRALDQLSGSRLGQRRLREIGETLGADVPSQVEPRHALVTGAGEAIEPLELPPFALVLVPQGEGLPTAAVYAEADRIGSTRRALDPGAARTLAAGTLAELAAGLENDLEPAALSLRPGLEEPLRALRAAGALAARITGSGPTSFGVFPGLAAARAAAARIPGAIVAEPRP